MKKAEICRGINNKANRLLKANNYSVFDKMQLRYIAELSAAESMKSLREIRQNIFNWEIELEECKQLYDNRNNFN